MGKITFKMLFSIGITWSTGSILRIESEDDAVKETVMNDIREVGDVDFMEFIGHKILQNIPRQSLFLADVEMVEMPTDSYMGTYKLLQLNVFSDSVLDNTNNFNSHPIEL